MIFRAASGTRPGRAVALSIAVAVAVTLGGCGRKAGLDPPPSTSLVEPQPASPVARTTYLDPTTPTGGAQQAPVQTTQALPPAPPVKRTFILDPLIQ